MLQNKNNYKTKLLLKEEKFFGKRVKQGISTKRNPNNLKYYFYENNVRT